MTRLDSVEVTIPAEKDRVFTGQQVIDALDAVRTSGSTEISLTSLGAVSDGVISRSATTGASNGQMTSGSAVVTGITYTPAMLGKKAVAVGAGAAGATLISTVAGTDGSGHPVLTDAASTSIGGADIVIGTDDHAAVSAANTLLATSAGLSQIVIRIPDGITLTSVTLNTTNGDFQGSTNRGSTLVACASYGPMIQDGISAPFTPTRRGGVSGNVFLHGMKLAQGLLYVGGVTGKMYTTIEAKNSAPGYYGLRCEYGQNHEFNFVVMSDTGGNCLEVASGSGGHAFYKCEWNNCGVGTNGNSYYNATIRQETQYGPGGYKNPSDNTFRDNIFERGDALGRGGCLYIGNAQIRILFDGCNFAIGGDITATNPGILRSAITINYEDHDTLTGDSTTGKNGSSQTGGIEFRGCTSQGSRGKVELNTNTPTDGWRVRDQSWTVDVDVASGGTFTLTDQNSGQTTGAKAWNISAANLQTALEGLGVIGSGNVLVSLSAAVYTITLQGSLTYVDPNAAGIKLVGSGAGLTGASTVNFAVGVRQSASPTIGILVNGGGTQTDLTIDGGRFFNHAAPFSVDDDSTISVKSMPATYAYGDLYLNPPQRTTNLAGTVQTRGSANTLLFDQVFMVRMITVPAFRTGTHNNNSAVGLSGIRPATPGMLRKDGDRVYILNDDASTWTAQGLQTDSAQGFTIRASSWLGPRCPTTTRAIVINTASSTQINAGQVYAIPIDLPTLTASFIGVNIITTIAAILSAPADASHYCRARVATYTDLAGLANTLITGTETTIDMTPTAGAQSATYTSAANTSTVRRVWVLCTFEGQGVTTWPTVTSSNLGLTVSSSTAPTSVIPTLGGLKEASASNADGSGVFTFVGYNAALVGTPIGAAPLAALKLA